MQSPAQKCETELKRRFQKRENPDEKNRKHPCYELYLKSIKCLEANK